MNSRVPAGLSTGGKSLWRGVLALHPDLDITQLAQLEEACRAKDRLDQLNLVLRGDIDTWAKLTTDINGDGTEYKLTINGALTHAATTANLMKQLIAALRLPDAETGKRPGVRPAPGAVSPQVPGGAKVPTALERARAAKGA